MNRTLFLSLLLLAAAASTATARDINPDKTKTPNVNGRPPVFASDPGAYFGPGAGFGIPGYGGGGANTGWANMGGGYGAGYGGPAGGWTRGGVVRPSVVCTEKGPCYKKRLTCPAKCFTSSSRSGRNYGGGGGGGGCTMDCKKKCVAYC